jgi:hypothetical protein
VATPEDQLETLYNSVSECDLVPDCPKCYTDTSARIVDFIAPRHKEVAGGVLPVWYCSMCSGIYAARTSALDMELTAFSGVLKKIPHVLKKRESLILTWSFR